MSTTMTVTQMVQCAVAYVDAGGNPAQVQGAPVWTSSDDTVVKVDVKSDGMKAIVYAAGKTGTAQVKVVADADLGDGVTELIGLLEMEIVAGQAVAANITAGAPEDIKVATPQKR